MILFGERYQLFEISDEEYGRAFVGVVTEGAGSHPEERAHAGKMLARWMKKRHGLDWVAPEGGKMDPL